jgi:hypothetical protein
MYDRQAACTASRWRLSVHITASTSDRYDNNKPVVSDQTSLTLTTTLNDCFTSDNNPVQVLTHVIVEATPQATNELPEAIARTRIIPMSHKPC